MILFLLKAKQRFLDTYKQQTKDNAPPPPLVSGIYKYT